MIYSETHVEEFTFNNKKYYYLGGLDVANHIEENDGIGHWECHGKGYDAGHDYYTCTEVELINPKVYASIEDFDNEENEIEISSEMMEYLKEFILEENQEGLDNYLEEMFKD